MIFTCKHCKKEIIGSMELINDVIIHPHCKKGYMGYQNALLTKKTQATKVLEEKEN